MRQRIFSGLLGAARAKCHVLPIDPGSAPVSFRRFGASTGTTPVPIKPAIPGAIHLSAWTYILTDSLTHKHHPPNYFQPTHQRKSSFIERPMLTHRPIQNHYDFELEAGIVKHCLGVKIVDIAMIKSKKNLLSGERCLTRLHVRTCTMHPNTLCRSHHRNAVVELNHCPIFCIARSKFPENRGLSLCTCVARCTLHHNTPGPTPSNSTRC